MQYDIIFFCSIYDDIKTVNAHQHIDIFILKKLFENNFLVIHSDSAKYHIFITS